MSDVSETVKQRIDSVDEIRSGHELYHDDVSLTVSFDHLSEPQAIALISMFETWKFHATVGSSRWVSFFVDGDGPFHPGLIINADGKVLESDSLKKTAEIDANKFDPDAVTGTFIDWALEVDDA